MTFVQTEVLQKPKINIMTYTDFTPKFKEKLTRAGFKEMDRSDRLTFADAPTHTLILETRCVTLLFAPSTEILIEAYYYGDADGTANFMWIGDVDVNHVVKQLEMFVHDMILSLSKARFITTAENFKPTQKLG